MRVPWRGLSLTVAGLAYASNASSSGWPLFDVFAGAQPSLRKREAGAQSSDHQAQSPRERGGLKHIASAIGHAGQGRAIYFPLGKQMPSSSSEARDVSASESPVVGSDSPTLRLGSAASGARTNSSGDSSSMLRHVPSVKFWSLDRGKARLNTTQTAKDIGGETDIGMILVALGLFVVSVMTVVVLSESGALGGRPSARLAAARQHFSRASAPTHIMQKWPIAQDAKHISSYGNFAPSTLGCPLPARQSPQAMQSLYKAQDNVGVQGQVLAPLGTVERTSVSTAAPQSIVPTPVPTMGLEQIPPFCPALVLPHCEAWFAVAFERLMVGSGTFNVLGLSGNPLLRATMGGGQSPSGASCRCLGISMTPTKSPTLATITAPQGPPGTVPLPLEVRGSGGRDYGELRAVYLTQYQLLCSGRAVLSLTLDAPTGQLLLHSTNDGQLICIASRCVENDLFSGTEHLQVRVVAGVDAVLVLCCVLAIVLFGPGIQLPTIAPPPALAPSGRASLSTTSSHY